MDGWHSPVQCILSAIHPSILGFSGIYIHRNGVGGRGQRAEGSFVIGRAILGQDVLQAVMIITHSLPQSTCNRFAAEAALRKV